MRALALLLLLAGAAPAPESRHEFVQAVEFPYYAYPPQLWERELVWLKNLGIDTVAFSIPWNWHQVDAETLDLAGRTSPRRDLIGFIRLVKRAGLRAWIRPAPPLKGWLDSGYPGGHADRTAARCASGCGTSTTRSIRFSRSTAAPSPSWKERAACSTARSRRFP